MAMRDLAVAGGVIINGLAILNEEPFVDSYYRYTVIGGDGAFLMTAHDYEDFAVAMLEKLIREIDLPPVSGRPPTARSTRAADTAIQATTSRASRKKSSGSSILATSASR